MKETINLIKIIISAIGAWIGYFIGELDGLIIALLLFVVIDYLTGLMVAIADRKLSSRIGFKGIFRKVIIFMLVAIAHVIDREIIKTGDALRTAIIFFYLSNEGISILENSVHLGLQVPKKLKDVLLQLNEDRKEKK